MNNIFRLEE